MMVWFRCYAFSASLILLAGCGANVATVPMGAGSDMPRNALRAALAGQHRLEAASIQRALQLHRLR